jgi:hypothetical protein
LELIESAGVDMHILIHTKSGTAIEYRKCEENSAWQRPTIQGQKKEE